MNAYIFDMDGTILSSIGFWKNFGTEVLHLNGINETIPHKVLEKMTLHEGVEYLIANYSINKSVEEVETGIFDLLYHKYRYDFELKEGVLEIFKLIKDKGHYLAIATATERRYVDGMLEKYPEILDYIDALDCVIPGGPTKADIEFFQELEENISGSPEEIFFFEDSPYSIVTANEVGWKTVAFLEDMNPHLREEAMKISDYFYENIKDMDIGILSL